VRITLYSVPGPSSWGANAQTDFHGGWKYSISSIQSLSSSNQDTEFEVVLGHLNSFGVVPSLPVIPRVSITVFQLDLKDLKVTYPNHQSSQHGALLNHIIGNHPPSTDFYIVIDPDFFVLGKNAISNLVNEMTLRNIDVSGVSYPCELPLPYYWDFPVVYFQIFKTSRVPFSILDFRPDESHFVKDLSQRSGYGLPRPRCLKLLNYFFYKLDSVLEWVGWVCFSEKVKTVRNLVINRFLYRNFDLFRDTGWKNRITLSALSIWIFPQLVRSSRIQMPFSKNAYLEHNPDVASSSVNPLWHLLNFGIYEKRQVGRINFAFGLISKLVASKGNIANAHPMSSVKSVDLLHENIAEVSHSHVVKRGFFYDLGAGALGIHLGHEAKDEFGNDLSTVQHIAEKLEKKES
jgi:hypothetical protein